LTESLAANRRRDAGHCLALADQAPGVRLAIVLSDKALPLCPRAARNTQPCGPQLCRRHECRRAVLRQARDRTAWRAASRLSHATGSSIHRRV